MAIRRREFITLLGGAAAAWPLAAPAQQSVRLKRIGMLMSFAGSDPEAPIRVSALLHGLQELGWTEGHNIRMDYHLAARDDIPAVTAAVVALAPDVLLVNGTSVLRAAQQAARNIPIVFVNVIDPVGQGFVQSLAKPGGNLTGFANVDFAMGGKWLELLKAIATDLTRVAVIGDEALGGGAGIMQAIEAAAASLQVELSQFRARDAVVIERALATFAQRPNSGLLVLPGSLTQFHRERIIALAAQHRLPAIYPYRYYVTSGGLMSYGIDTADVYRRTAAYVDRILKGAKPGELPVQQPTKFELVINVRAAKALGLEVSPALLSRADEVIA